ncbi:MAG: GAF domain-containing protein, partial [Rhodospirillaceae bacterium]|nr:GAF domain-containing protein [Rhodospirillaceae bacterium]
MTTPTSPSHPDSQISPVSRRLLARVRDVMASPLEAQQRLDQIVSVIATDMVAEVCSIYVMRAGEVLELFATEGLKSSAVHNTRLRVGEGLVGLIAAQARPVALADAQSHSDFAYRPETGEELYQSLLGVPVLRSGRVIGVIAVQNQTRRNYGDEEVEILETVAMVLAELISGGELISRAELMPADGNALLPLRIEGISLNPGLGLGVAVLHAPQFNISELVAEDVDYEHERLHKAVAEMHGALDDMMNHSDLAVAGEHREILESYRMIAEDAGWFARIDEAISSGLTAE